jgi:glycosyltransferase involved in cell wall biosynthesis
LLIAGDGPLRETLERTAAEVGASIRVLGHRSDLPNVIAAADVIALPSTSEGMSNVVLQALAGSRPVVSFDIPGVTELIEPDRAGWLVSPGDWDGLIDRVVEALLQPEESRQRGTLGRAFVAKRHDINVIAAWYDDLYHGLS